MCYEEKYKKIKKNYQLTGIERGLELYEDDFGGFVVDTNQRKIVRLNKKNGFVKDYTAS